MKRNLNIFKTLNFKVNIKLKIINFVVLVYISQNSLAQFKNEYFLKLADENAPISTYYLHISTQYGKVLNQQLQPLENGIGATVSLLIPDDWLNRLSRNYFTLGIKGLNSPHPGKPYLSTMNIKGDKEIDDSFNYFQILAGYRFSERIKYDGFYNEQRAGFILWDFHDNDKNNLAFVLTSSFGYVLKNYDFAIFGDAGFSQRRTNIATRQFYAIGISVGYNFGLYKVHNCRCEPYSW